jgi:holo-[acyl-carrier protein] synthase
VPINVGIDLVETDEVRESMRTHGDRYLTRIYTESEQRDCGSNPRLLAARFAAKEATMKALGRGEEPLPWRSIAVLSDPDGGLELELSGEAEALARQRRVEKLTLSVTYRRSMAAAVVFAELGGVTCTTH